MLASISLGFGLIIDIRAGQKNVFDAFQGPR